MVNADLTGAAMDDDESPLGLKGRWRATVAHEACHVLFHRCLFNLNPQQGSLFGDDDKFEETTQRLQRCLKRDVVYGRMGSDWREVQANMGMAALLMPQGVFTSVAKQELSRLGVERVCPDTTAAATLARRLATAFEVSCQAAMIRLKTLKVLATPGQDYLM
jgi:Zn-dependent peptidase ImmA (M78 family)